LPSNYITKEEAPALGWEKGGNLDEVGPGKSIGRDRFGNYERKLPAGSFSDLPGRDHT
jgi:ribonuclease T1